MGILGHNVNMYIGVDHDQKVGDTVVLEYLGHIKLNNYNYHPENTTFISRTLTMTNTELSINKSVELQRREKQRISFRG